jgi:hypothetical protein
MAKIDVIRKKMNGKITPIDLIEIADKLDNSKTKKYVEHLVRFTNNLKLDFEAAITHDMEYMMDYLLKFDELVKNDLIEVPDLNKHKSFNSVKNSIKEASLVKSISKAKNEIKVLYEDDKYMLFLPLSFDAAAVYGRGTKWCITQKTYFYKYTDKGILAYFIEKGINRKIGLYYDMDKSYYYNNIGLSVDIVNIMSELGDSKSLSSEINNDFELKEIYNFAKKFSCWTDWDEKMDMMFIPVPNNIKELFINYCKENNIQNASLLNEIETENLVKIYESESKFSDIEPMGYENEMEAPQEQAYENNPVANYEF